MKHTYSSANIKPKKFIKSEIKNLNFGGFESPLFSGFLSPKSSHKNEKTKAKSKTNTNSKVNLNFVDSKSKNNLINIKLNIQSEIINNNYNEHKKNKKENLEKVLETKDKIVDQLQKEISKTKYQIELSRTKNNLKNSIEKFENPDNFLNEKMHKIQKERSKLATIKTSSVISKNVRQYFKNYIFKNSKSLSKTPTPTSIISSGNRKQLTLNSTNSSLNSNLLSSKNFNCYNSNYPDVENILSGSPRYDIYRKTMNKSNSLLSSMGQFMTKKISQRNHHSREKSLNVHKNINNSWNSTNTNYQENTNEFERIKTRTKEVMIKYINYINENKT